MAREQTVERGDAQNRTEQCDEGRGTTRRNVLKTVALGGVTGAGLLTTQTERADADTTVEGYVLMTQRFTNNWSDTLGEASRLQDRNGTVDANVVVGASLTNEHLPNFGITGIELSGRFPGDTVPTDEFSSLNLADRAATFETFCKNQSTLEQTFKESEFMLLVDHVPEAFDSGSKAEYESTAMAPDWSASTGGTSNKSHILNFAALENRAGFHQQTGFVGISFRALADLYGGNTTDADTENGEWSLGANESGYSFCGGEVDWSASKQGLFVTSCTRNVF